MTEDGHVWFTASDFDTNSQKLCRFIDGDLELYILTDNFVSMSVQSADKIWFTTHFGFFLYNSENNNITSVNPNPPSALRADERINFVMVHDNDDVIVTSKYKVYINRNGVWSTLVDQGFLTLSSFVDHDNKLWLSQCLGTEDIIHFGIRSVVDS